MHARMPALTSTDLWPPWLAPAVQDLASWDGAFISSTSRLALPLDELAAPDYSPPLARRWERHGGCELVQRLERLVLARIEAHSEPLE